jgi:hypothetical protein
LGALERKVLVFVHTAIWYVLRPFGYFVVIWEIFPGSVHCTKINLATLSEGNPCP